jgi:Spermine/spermidine synthase domain
MDWIASWKKLWAESHQEQTDFVDRIPQNRVPAAILLASAACLFIEMVMVRWHGTCFHGFAIFKNISLLSCFLGLGIGFGLPKERRLTLAAFLPLLAIQTAVFGILSMTNLGGRIMNPIAEQNIMGLSGGAWGYLHAVEGNGFLLGVFALNAFMFIPLGHLTGRIMGRMPQVQSYSLNLLGSLVGIGLFFGLSLLWSGPEVWMGMAILMVAPFLFGSGRLAPMFAGCIAVILLAFGVLGSSKMLTFYSPYQVISLKLPAPDANGKTVPSIRVNHCYYQDVMDCTPIAADKDEPHRRAADYYNLPYQLQKRAGEVLVVGAGTGNDVAAALRNEATRVTAVELDPAILNLGRMIHPERPYQDPRTRAVVNDARSYFRQTGETFDTIVYGLLDSHTNLGAMTNVRVDSFVYTVEGFREAIARLKPDGMVVVSYTLLDPAQGRKLYAMLQAAYPEQTTRVFSVAGGSHDAGTTFATGPGVKNLPTTVAGIAELTDEFRAGVPTTDLATDDWPFFYMKQRVYPFSYLVMIGLMLAVSAWMVRSHFGPKLLASASQAVFFFMGAGFMLIETKGITELGLVFGNTWSVVAVVVTCILMLGFLANQWVSARGPVSIPLTFGLLAAALAGGWGVSHYVAAGGVMPMARVTMPIVLNLPLLFAGLVFSSLLLRTKDIGAALSANIFGAMLGGFLEYNSMYWGYSSLYPIGLALYGLACVSYLRMGAGGAARISYPVKPAEMAA